MEDENPAITASDTDTDDIIDEDGIGSGGETVLEISLKTDSPERLDRALMAETEGLFPLSRARLQALIEAGNLTFGGTPLTDGKHKARAGRYTLTIPAPVSAIPELQDLPLDILFEDAHLIVVNKPAGMAAHPGPGTPDGTLVNALLYHCGASLSGIGGVMRPGIVHRLDKETSGVMVAAKSDTAHRGLSSLFEKHDIERAYLALLRGVPRPLSGTVKTRIGRSTFDRKKMAVLRTGGREAITHYKVLDIFGPQDRPCASLIECRLETGRTHQIRVHMAHLGMPCLGDPVYGSGGPARAVAEAMQALGFKRQALHAAVLGFVHPVTGDTLRFDAPLPPDMAALKDGLTQL